MPDRVQDVGIMEYPIDRPVRDRFIGCIGVEVEIWNMARGDGLYLLVVGPEARYAMGSLYNVHRLVAMALIHLLTRCDV